MIFMKTEDEYIRHCNFKGFLAEELDKRYSPNPWVFQDAIQYREPEQHFTVNFRSFDGSRRLSVGVKWIAREYRYTFSER